jgi:hypothetical protein
MKLVIVISILIALALNVNALKGATLYQFNFSLYVREDSDLNFTGVDCHKQNLFNYSHEFDNLYTNPNSNPISCVHYNCVSQKYQRVVINVIKNPKSDPFFVFVSQFDYDNIGIGPYIADHIYVFGQGVYYVNVVYFELKHGSPYLQLNANFVGNSKYGSTIVMSPDIMIF